MKKALLRTLSVLLSILAIVVALVVLFLGWITLKDYRPPPQEDLIPVGTVTLFPALQDTFTVCIWNIGYFGLGAGMDFFYDGGKGVRPTHEEYLMYQDGALKFLFRQGVFDFFLLQEVDRHSRRSYGNDQVSAISEILDDYCYVYAKNYDVPFVPMPLCSPMGHVEGGIMTLSRRKADQNIRYAFAGDASWPLGLFMLDRCFLLSRFSLPSGKDLVIINTHNSAFDDGSRRRQQLAVLRKVMLDEFSRGNFVVCGGDWNQNPPGYQAGAIKGQGPGKDILPPMEHDLFPEGWTWAYDPEVPTNRDVRAPYQKGKTQVTIIDYFVCSPNIEILDISTLDLEFRYADHQPVTLLFRLITPP
jgi:endonuclease/exonuclease/phosphatase family metal-dependent hydrolase